MIVVDTNVISYLLIPNGHYHDAAVKLFKKDSNWVAPSLWHYEFLSVLTVYQRKSLIDSFTCKQLFQKAREIVETRDHASIDTVFKIIESSSISAYDCNFVALAVEMGLPFITEDRKIINEFEKMTFSLEQYTT